ncbi:glycosyltransferase [Arthrobacter ginkgonis]|uniref:Glycosyltransferase n=1 Tax=Arthrobacter ginkgonis TaxID=1630594 RepID=A0ABP7CB56_9MICC
MQGDATPDGVSLLVIVRGREQHLRRLIDGANRAAPRPREIVVVHMGEADTEDLRSRIPIRQFRIEVPGTGTLPLARARNLAAHHAEGSRYVFLDVDCIPARDLFGILAEDSERLGGIAMAEPRYLRAPLPPGTPADDGALTRDSVPHAARAGLHASEGALPSERYEMFWTLGFAVDAADFGRIGGFDESFTGYGAEDTDFAFTARERGVPLGFSGATMFHQHHGSYRPPLNHFADIVANATVFHGKWGTWPMEGWLGAFTRLGLVDWSPSSSAIRVLRAPTAMETEAAAHAGAY